jgi:hypothetical protein
MTGSRSSRAAIGVWLACCLGAAPAALAQGQTGQRPVGQPVPLLQQQPLPPPPGATAPSKQAPATRAQPDTPAAGGIQVETLGSFDRGGVGLLDDGDGGLGAGMWQDSDRDLVAGLLATLPVASTSPAQQDLTRRLLLSTATPPAGEGGDLIGARLQRLLAAGQVDDVLALAERAALNASSASEPATRAVAEANLLSGRTDPACAIADARLATAEDGYWQQLATFCLALADKRSQVDFNIDLLREIGTKDDAYFALLPAVMGGKARLKSLPAPTPLHMAMLDEAGVKPPADMLDGAGPPIWRALALDTDTPMPLRLAAAERAAAAGALPVETLAEAYRAVPFAADKLAGAEQAARDEPGPETNALLLQAASAEADPAAQARLVQLALAAAQRQGDRYPLLARIYRPMLAALTPSAAMTWFAQDAGRALLAAGDLDGALGWFRSAHIGASNREAVALAAVVELWPLLTVADDAERVGYGEETLDTWWQVRQEEADPARFGRAQALLAGLQVTGRPVRETALWQSVAPVATETAPVPSPQIAVALADAAAAGRGGETVLLALHALGDNGPGNRHISTVATVAAALAQAGLEKEARRIMVEAMLARGF